jgi:hypothetical protein
MLPAGGRCCRSVACLGFRAGWSAVRADRIRSRWGLPMFRIVGSALAAGRPMRHVGSVLPATLGAGVGVGAVPGGGRACGMLAWGAAWG